MIRIDIAGRPIAWQRAGVNNGRFYDRQLDEKIAYQWEVKKTFTNAPKIGPLVLSCIFCFQMPKSWTNAKRMRLEGTHHESRPDLDNLVKWVGDACNGILWKDDAQIVEFDEMKKIWLDEDKTIIIFDDIVPKD